MAEGKGQKAKKKTLITGANGMFGGSLLGQLKKRYSIKGITRKEADITDLNAITKVIAKAKPDIVIHTAAYTKVDDCESNINLAYKVNAIGARNVAIACHRIEAALVYISTDYVFDGTKDSPYIEFDPVNPLNIYGKSKLAGEIFVQQLLKKFYIIRTSWLYGKGGANFVDTIINRAKNVGAHGNAPLKIVDDQTGSPTYANDLADKIGDIIKEERYGIYHATNSGVCSWFEFAKRIIECAGIKGIDIIPIKSHSLNRPAKRPSNSVLKNFMLELEGIPLLRSWDEAVREHIGKNGQ